MMHEQIMVKVNAHVDRGIAPLVEALNELPDVVTTESCEGGESREAHVSFRVGEDWQPLAEFVHDLSAALSLNAKIADCTYSVSIEWYAGGETPMGYLRVPRPHIAALAEAVSSVASASLLHHDRP